MKFAGTEKEPTCMLQPLHSGFEEPQEDHQGQERSVLSQDASALLARSVQGRAEEALHLANLVAVIERLITPPKTKTGVKYSRDVMQSSRSKKRKKGKKRLNNATSTSSQYVTARLVDGEDFSSRSLLDSAQFHTAVLGWSRHIVIPYQ